MPTAPAPHGCSRVYIDAGPLLWERSKNFSVTLTINLPDEQAAALKAKAAASGTGTVQAAANIVLEEMRKVSAEVMAELPKDDDSQHDHYLYGWPKSPRRSHECSDQ